MTLQQKILVIGDIMLDHYIYGKCDRISPEAPVPVVEIIKETSTLGGAGNVLKNLSAFGVMTDICAVIGDDNGGDQILEKLIGMNISVEMVVKDESRCTTIKSRVLAANHQLIRLDKEKSHAIRPEIQKALIKMLNKVISDYDAVVVSDYNKGLLSQSFLTEIFKICRAAGVLTILDPKTADFSRYNGVNIIKPNRKEAALATGIAIDSNENLEKACRQIKLSTGCEAVVITLSEDGIALFMGDELQIISTRAMDVSDVTGAGDTVLAAIGFGISNNMSLFQACEFANKAAAVVVSKIGSATTTLREIEERFPNHLNF